MQTSVFTDGFCFHSAFDSADGETNDNFESWAEKSSFPENRVH